MTMLVEEEDGTVKTYGAYSPRIQDKLTDAQKALLRKNSEGQPPTYAEWLKAQPAAGQNSVLGKSGGEKFRANDGSLTRAATPSTKRQLAALPKPLPKSQIKRKKPPAVDPRPGADKVKPAPKRPPAPAGSGGGKVVAKPKTKKAVPAPSPKPKPAPRKQKPKPELVNDGGKAFKEAQAAKAEVARLKKELAAAKKQAPKPASLSPQEKAEKKAAEFARKEAARQKARQVAEKAKAQMLADPSIPESELNAALAAANKPIIRTPPKEGVYGQTGIDPVPLFNSNTENVLGRGAFGTAVRTPKGVAKRGFIAPAETKALKALEKTGVTPKLLGESYSQPKATKGTFSIPTRKGTILMEEVKGKPIVKQLTELSDGEKQDAFDGLLKSRGKMHRAGAAHNDMHSHNLLWDKQNKQMNIIDMGLVRLDERAALVEALGTRRGRRTSFGEMVEPGDYQSQSIFKALNPRNASAKNSEVWKRFDANRQKVEKLIAEDGLADEFKGASIRTLPKSISQGMTKARAKELIDMLYDGI